MLGAATKPRLTAAPTPEAADLIARIHQLRADRAENDAAQERGREQIRSINARRSALSSGRADGSDAAAALLAGDNVDSASGSDSALAAERDAVQAGILALASRGHDIAAELQEAQSELAGALMRDVEPTTEAVLERARRVLSDLASVYADLMALVDGTKSHAAHAALVDVRAALEQLCISKLVDGRSRIPVSATVRAALPDADTVRLADCRLIESVPFPMPRRLT